MDSVTDAGLLNGLAGMNGSSIDTTTADPYPHVQASYKWAAVAGGIAIFIFIAAVGIIIIKVKQKARKERQANPPRSATTTARCQSLPDGEKQVSSVSSQPPSLRSLEYRDPADLIQDFRWYAVDKPQDDADVLNQHVPRTTPIGQEAWTTPPRTQKVSFSDQGEPSSPPPSPTKVASSSHLRSAIKDAPSPRSTPAVDSDSVYSFSQISTLPAISTSLTTDSKVKVSSTVDKTENNNTSSKDLAADGNTLTTLGNNKNTKDAMSLHIPRENGAYSRTVKREVERTGSVLSSQEVQEQTIFIPDEEIIDEDETPHKTPDKMPSPKTHTTNRPTSGQRPSPRYNTPTTDKPVATETPSDQGKSDTEIEMPGNNEQEPECYDTYL